MNPNVNLEEQYKQFQQPYTNQEMPMWNQQYSEYQPQKASSANNYATWALWLGIFSVLSNVCCCGFGGIIGIIGVILGIVAIKDKQCSKMANATVGLGLSVISVLITVILPLGGLLNDLGNAISNNNNVVESEQIVEYSEDETTEIQEDTIGETTETIITISEPVRLDDIQNNTVEETSTEDDEVIDEHLQDKESTNTTEEVENVTKPLEVTATELLYLGENKNFDGLPFNASTKEIYDVYNDKLVTVSGTIEDIQYYDGYLLYLNCDDTGYNSVGAEPNIVVYCRVQNIDNYTIGQTVSITGIAKCYTYSVVIEE